MPRDKYIFEFSAGEIPCLISARKQIILPSVDKQQAVSLLMLCSKTKQTVNLYLSNVDADNLLIPDNLFINGKVKLLISADKAFLYNKDKKQKKKSHIL